MESTGMVRLLSLLLFASTAGAEPPAPGPQHTLHGVATEHVQLDAGELGYRWSFDVRRSLHDVGSMRLDRVRFGNARTTASDVAALDQGEPSWAGLVGWDAVPQAQALQLDGQAIARAVARWKRRLGPQPEHPDEAVESSLVMLAQVEAVARWRSWIGLWLPATARESWWSAFGGGGAPPLLTDERLADGALRRTARYRIDGVAPPIAIPLGAPFWQALDARSSGHPLFALESVGVQVTEVADFADGADWPSRVAVERRLGPDPQGRTWTVRQELRLEWRVDDAEPPPLADDSPWIEHVEPAAGLDGDRDPYYRLTRAPEYPSASVAARFAGSVELRVTLDDGGVPTLVEPRTSTGVPELDDAAVEAVRGWRFWPRLQGGVAVPSEAVVPVNFRLREAAAPVDGPR
jgi:TonB family protein